VNSIIKFVVLRQLVGLPDESTTIWVGVSRSNDTQLQITTPPADGWIDLLNNNAEIPSSDFIHFENDFQMFVWKEKW